MSTQTIAQKKVEMAKELPGAKNLETTTTEAKNVQKGNEKAEQVKTMELLKKLTPTAEQRLQNLEHFQILGNRHKFLKSKEDELSKFMISSDGTKERITLSNASGFTFEVSNSQTIEKVVQVIETDLKSFLKKSEEEILNFTV
jgi:hypothetical protein